jgi:prophage antirepressor-like protein
MFKQLLNTFKKNEQKELNTFNKTIKLMPCVDCGKIYCNAKDVCEFLEIEDAEQALKQLDSDMKSEMFSDSDEDWDLSEPSKIDVLTLSGLFTLVFQSQTLFAKDTQRWIVDEFVENIFLKSDISKELGLLPAEVAC